MWGEQIGWNPYHYSANNPVNFLDPSGLFSDEIYLKNVRLLPPINSANDRIVHLKGIGMRLVDSDGFDIMDQTDDGQKLWKAFTNIWNDGQFYDVELKDGGDYKGRKEQTLEI